MPKAPVPRLVSEFLARPNPAVMATIRPDGSPHTAATWYDWEDGRVLVNVDRSRRRLAYLGDDGRVSLTVLKDEGWYHHVTLAGRVASIEDDPDLRGIDRLSRRYMGNPYGDRGADRVSVWLAVERWHGWLNGRPWPPPDA